MRKIVTLLLIGLLVVGVGVFAADKKVVDVMHGWPGEQAPVFLKIN